MSLRVFVWVFTLISVFLVGGPSSVSAAARASASSSLADSPPGGAIDGDRFSNSGAHAWKGAKAAVPGTTWSWQISFDQPRAIGALLQIQGDHEFVFTNAPLSYIWLASEDGEHWQPIPETSVASEARLYRLHRFKQPVHARHLQLRIHSACGDYPTLREVEFYESPQAAVSFPEWVLIVNSTDDPRLPNHGQEFLPLIRSCPGWNATPAQQVWVNDFTPGLAEIEPRPLCAFLSGSFKDWCEVDRRTWRGTEQLLQRGTLPMWASCGGAQALAILAETGTDKPWDCPHCRDPKHPKLPIYTHIGHTAPKPCGDYSACIFERGPHKVLAVKDDPVFRDLPMEFEVMESHCGQIEWPPEGWALIATAGTGSKTKTQCLRRIGQPIYAAQFHIEMDGTPAASRLIMGNFLDVARAWNKHLPQRE